MAHWRMAITSDTLQAADLQGRDITAIIEKAVPSTVPDRKDPKIEKGVLLVYFKGKRKPLLVKATNAKAIQKLAGSPDIDKWKGVPITMHGTTTFAFGENHEVIRIRPNKPTAALAKDAANAPAEPEPPPTDIPPDHVETRPPNNGPTADEQAEILAAERKAVAHG